jgi:hypothetical protein
VSEIRKLTSRWHRDELGAERKAARRKCSKAYRTWKLRALCWVLRRLRAARNTATKQNG